MAAHKVVRNVSRPEAADGSKEQSLPLNPVLQTHLALQKTFVIPQDLTIALEESKKSQLPEPEHTCDVDEGQLF